MKLLSKIAVSLLCAVSLTAFASTSNATATITDLDGNVWANGTFDATLTSAIGGPTVAGAPVTLLRASGTISSSGVLTATLTDTSSIDQAGATWSFHITPNASSRGVDITGIAVVGASPNLSAALSAGLKGPRFNTSPSAYGYADIEANPFQQGAGATYYNVTLQTVRQWNGSAWTGSGGGSSVLTGTATPQGLTGATGATYMQTFADGSSKLFTLSANGGVWSAPDGTVVYAGANSVIGFTNNYEMNEGTGTTLNDSVGTTNLTFNTTAPAWNSTNGLTYNSTNNQFVIVPQSFWTQHSTYMICANIVALATGLGPLLGQTGTGLPSLGLDNYGANGITTSGGFNASSSSIQPITFGAPVCLTVVYNGAGQDQYWLGSTKLTLKNNTNTASTATAAFGLGGFFHGLNGTIYKFGAAVGTELPADIIQHNALVQSAKIATATSLTANTVTVGYKQGSPIQWCIGDSITSGNGFLPNTYCFLLPTLLNIPGVTVFNGGTSGQLLTNYVSQGIFTQAANFIMQYTVPGQAAPPHFAGLYMGINDITQNVTAATLYTAWKAAIKPLYAAGWLNIAVSLTPSALQSSTVNTQRLAFNALIANGGNWNGFVDWANDLRMTNPAFPQIGAAVGFGVFSPYYQDAAALHPSAIGGAALNGRYMNTMNALGEIGKGTVSNAIFGSAVDIDMAQGHSQALTLTGNVTTLKVINGNQGDTLDLTICQDATGSRTVPTVAVGSGATATVTSAGVMTLTAGGSGYDSNYLPVFYVTGLTCTQYPRYQATITAGAVASIAANLAGTGCTGTGTVTVVSTEPAWNNFNTTAVNALAPSACKAQHFAFDGVAQSIN